MRCVHTPAPCNTCNPCNPCNPPPQMDPADSGELPPPIGHWESQYNVDGFGQVRLGYRRLVERGFRTG